MRIADRRVRSSSVVELEDFRPCISQALDGPEWSGRFQAACETIKAKLEPSGQRSQKYRDWYDATAEKKGTPREVALAWKTLEILIARSEGKKQQLLFDEVLPAADLDSQADSSVANAAELFLILQLHLKSPVCIL